MDSVTTGCKSYNWVFNSIRLLAVFVTQFPYINTDFCYVMTPVGLLGSGKFWELHTRKLNEGKFGIRGIVYDMYFIR